MARRRKPSGIPASADPFITHALDQFKFSAKTYGPQRKRENDALQFQVGELQWAPEIRDYRSAQFGNQGVPTPPDPTLSISMIDEPISLVENQERAAHLGITIHALSEDASADTAVVLQELYRHIETDPDSQASNARSWMFGRTLRAGTGWYYIEKVFDPDGGHPFDQKLLIKRILYQSCIFPDPTAQMADWSDGMFLHDLQYLSWDAYKKKYPKSQLASGPYGDSDFELLSSDKPDWVKNGGDPGTRAIAVSNYWRVECTYQKYVLLDNGDVALVSINDNGEADPQEDELPDGRRIATDDDAQRMDYDGIRERDVEIRCVYRSVINCVETLEPEIEWDGRYIPYVPGIGVELQPFDGERRWQGMIAPAMDSQRLVNYSASQAVKIASLEPQAPWQGEEGVFEGHEREYSESNTRKYPYLQHKPTNSAGQRSEKPTRVQVDVSRLGPSMELLSMGKDFVQRAMFTFGPGLGEQTPAFRSGDALEQLKGQTTLGTSHYLDNEASISMPLEAKIVLDLIPHVYDRPGRVLHVLTGAGNTRQVMLNAPYAMQNGKPTALPPMPEGMPLPEGAMHYDLAKGRYGVTVTIGKQQDSRKQEGSDAIGRLMEAEPSLIPVLGPTWAKFQDFPGAEAMKEAMMKWQAHAAPFMVDQPNANLPAQLAQMQSQLQAVSQAASEFKQKLDTDWAKNQAQVMIKQLEFERDKALQQMKDATQIEVARINAAKEGMIAEREAAEERLATGLKIVADASKAELDRAHENVQNDKQRRHEVATTGLEHGAQVAASAQEHEQAVQQSKLDNAHALQQADLQRQIAEAAQPQNGQPTGS